MANRGDELLKILTAEFITKLERLVNKLDTGTVPIDDADNYNTIVVKNHNTTAKKKFEIVALDSPVITYTGAINHRHERLEYTTKALTSAEPHNWAVLQQPLPGQTGATAEALMVGLTWVKTSASMSAYTQLQCDGTNLVSSSEGKGTALFSYSDSSSGYNTLITVGSLSGAGNTVFIVGSGGIAATNNTGSLPWTLSSASCTKTKVVGTQLQSDGTATVYNIDNIAIPEHCVLIAHKVGSVWIAQQVIKRLRVSGYNFQENPTTRSETPWRNWATGGECPP